MTVEPLIFDALDVTLSGRTVLDGISATLRPGRITVILGPNGAGKSSLVKAAAALIEPVAGSVRLGSRDIATLDPRERARVIGYLPQDASVHWNVAASEIVMLGRVPHRTPFAGPGAADIDAVARAMTATGTTHLADRPVHELSGGERARVLLARVLAGEPRWLLADEPLASLDPAHQLDILDRLADVARRGAGVAIVLHDLLHAGRVADDVILLKEGRLLAEGPAAAVLTPDTLRTAFDLEVSVSQDAGGGLLCLAGGRRAPSG